MILAGVEQLKASHHQGIVGIGLSLALQSEKNWVVPDIVVGSSKQNW